MPINSRAPPSPTKRGLPFFPCSLSYSPSSDFPTLHDRRLHALALSMNLNAFLSSLYSCFRRRLKAPGDSDGVDSSDLFFEIRTLQIATNSFSELNQLGHGGFGPVYKVIGMLCQGQFRIVLFSIECLK